MVHINQVQLVGNLTRDPESGTTQSGVSYCRFRVACRRQFKNAKGQYDADYIDCVAWRQAAEFIQKYFIKGNKIGLLGNIHTGSYTAQDGSKRYTYEVVVKEVEFVAPRSDSGSGGRAAPPPVEPPRQRDEQQRMDYSAGEFVEVEDDDLPF